MEREEIISSGLLELYAAGIASEEEVKEVEGWIMQYPEVAEELREIESSLERYVLGQSITPAAEVKNKIFARISTPENARVIPMNSTTAVAAGPTRNLSFWKMAAAASVLLLIGSVIANLVMYNKYREADQELLAANQSLQNMEVSNKQMEQGIDIVQSKYSIPVALKGLEAAPEAAAKVFWMQNTGEVFIDPSNLPAAPAGKAYQLWGIVDGKPVSGGMIGTTKSGEKFSVQKMKSFGKVEAFAITLEPEQGNETPMGPMYVMGKM